jgi:hypothetical protein
MLALLVLGAVAGFAGTFVSRHLWLLGGPGGLPVPWGLALTVAASLGLFLGGGRLLASNGVLVAALGWLAPVVVFMLPRVEGDVLLAQDGRGIGFLFAGVVGAAVAFGRALTRGPESRPFGNPAGMVGERAAEADRSRR